MFNDREKKLRPRYPMISNQHHDDRSRRVGDRSVARTKTTPGKKPEGKQRMNVAVGTPDQDIAIHQMVLHDGLTHINIDSHAKTELGRMLVHKYPSKFEHPTFGRFKSIEGFWGYIRDGARDDRWRYVSGMSAKRETRALGPRFIANFHQIIMEANFLKVEQNETVRALMIASTLPFEHYYIFRSEEMSPDNPGVPTRPQIASWLTRGFEEIRTMLIKGTRPEKPDYSDIYEINQS